MTPTEQLCLEKEKNLIEQKENIYYNNPESTCCNIKNNTATNSVAKTVENMSEQASESKDDQKNDYEQKVMNAYNRFATEANDDFGKYLDDEDDCVVESNKKKPERKSTDIITANSNNGTRAVSKTNANTDKTQFDMCGLYALEAPPLAKDYRTNMQDSTNQGGALYSLKNKIKNFFSGNDRDNYATADYARTIQAVQYGSSKIGHQSGYDYDEYYSQVKKLRDFDTDARVNNFKYNPNLNIAVMDDELNLHFKKAHPACMDNNNANPHKKNKSLKLPSFFSKVKLNRDQNLLT